MSVSLYYHARRGAPLAPAESAAVERIVRARQESFPFPDEESLYLYAGGQLELGEILSGSTKMPLEPSHLLPVVAHLLDSVTALRRALPDAEWRLNMDDMDIEWEEEAGYSLPWTRDPDLQAELEKF